MAEKKPTRKLGKRRVVEKPPPDVQENLKKYVCIECSREACTRDQGLSVLREAHSPPHTPQLRPPTTRHRRFLTLLSSTQRSGWYYSGSPPFFFSQWPPSSFVIDGVSYSCAEQYMMVDFFSGPRPSGADYGVARPTRATKRLGRGVHKFDCAT